MLPVTLKTLYTCTGQQCITLWVWLVLINGDFNTWWISCRKFRSSLLVKTTDAKRTVPSGSPVSECVFCCLPAVCIYKVGKTSWENFPFSISNCPGIFHALNQKHTGLASFPLSPLSSRRLDTQSHSLPRPEDKVQHWAKATQELNPAPQKCETSADRSLNVWVRLSLR